MILSLANVGKCFIGILAMAYELGSVCPSVCFSVHPSVHLSVDPSVCPSVCPVSPEV